MALRMESAERDFASVLAALERECELLAKFERAEAVIVLQQTSDVKPTLLRDVVGVPSRIETPVRLLSKTWLAPLNCDMICQLSTPLPMRKIEDIPRFPEAATNPRKPILMRRLAIA